MWHMYGYGFNYAWLWMLGFSLIKILAVIGLVILFIRLINRDRIDSYKHSSKAMEILKEKYAKGEISEEEYKHKKKILRS
ncbi:SHOCT domain-containing protein [Caloranaerobacter ferrireducens]|uniref:SHOCT domain-containing protein n=1 Tax=Caloranaerobacter ferrireducens TaxID=1323370 RepID=UPI00084DE445|nr:SHOCT domain-containing protein [Caloranaerobacter ferrireducens]